MGINLARRVITVEFQTIVTIMIVIVVVSGGGGGDDVILVCFGDGGDDGVACGSDGDDCGINDCGINDGDGGGGGNDGGEGIQACSLFTYWIAFVQHMISKVKHSSSRFHPRFSFVYPTLILSMIFNMKIIPSSFHFLCRFPLSLPRCLSSHHFNKFFLTLFGLVMIKICEY